MNQAIGTFIVSFPILAFAKICAKETGAKIHQTAAGNYTLALNYKQRQIWDKKKESFGI